MTDSTPTIPASTFALLYSPVAAQILSSSSWPVYRYQGATVIATYLSCHTLQDLLDIIEVLYEPIWRLHAQIVPKKRLTTFAEVVQHLAVHGKGTGLEKKKASDLDFGADYLRAVWALASKDSKIAARFEVKGSLESVRSLHKMWSLQSWIWGNKEWFSGYGLSARQKKVLIQPWVDNDEEELKQSEEKAAFSVLKEKQTQAPMAKLPGLPKKPLRSIPIFWANDNAAEEIHAWYANTKMNQDVIANMTWESFRDKIRRCFPLQDRSQNIDKIYLQQHVSTGSSSTIATETELQPDLWTEQRITLSDQDPYTTNLLFTSKQVSSTELRDAFWETWSDVVEIWAAAITEERELELEGIDDPEERQKRMQPREGKAELEARLEKYRARHPDSKVGLEGGGNPRGKRMWAMAVDETAIDEKMANAKRKKV